MITGSSDQGSRPLTKLEEAFGSATEGDPWDQLTVPTVTVYLLLLLFRSVFLARPLSFRHTSLQTGLHLQFGDRNGKVMFGRAGIVSLRCFSTLVSPGSLNCSAQSCGSCSTSPASTEESGQTTLCSPGGAFLRNVFSKGHIPLFPGPVSSRNSFGLISMCMGVFGDH